MIWDENNHAIACRIRIVNSAEDVIFAHRMYRAWHMGLKMLATFLKDEPERLVGHRVEGPRAAAEPWAISAHRS